MHIEPFEPRRLMAVSGLDRRFGDGDGRVELGSGYAVLSVAGSGDDVYALVLNHSKRTQSIYKYDSAGHTDRSFGSFGSARLAFNTPSGLPSEAAKIAVDPRTGSIYVGFTGSRKTGTVARATLQVERLTAAGKADTTFGDGGVYAYTSQLRQNPGADVDFTLGRLVPLTHGQLLIAMDTRQSTDNDDGSHFLQNGTTDVQLQRLRTDGRRDRTFGKNGVQVVASGTFTRTESDGGGSQGGITQTFGDLQLRDDGNYRVILSDDDYDRTATGTNTVRSTVRSQRQIESDVLGHDGSIDEAGSYVRNLTSANITRAVHPYEFVPVQVAAEGDDGVLVIGLNTDHAVTPQNNPVGALQIHLTSASRSAATALALPRGARLQSLTQSDGTTYVTTTAGVTAFDVHLDPDRTWGTGGTTAASDATAYFPDDDGRLLFTYDEGYGRLVG